MHKRDDDDDDDDHAIKVIFTNSNAFHRKAIDVPTHRLKTNNVKFVLMKIFR